MPYSELEDSFLHDFCILVNEFQDKPFLHPLSQCQNTVFRKSPVKYITLKKQQFMGFFWLVEGWFFCLFVFCVVFCFLVFFFCFPLMLCSLVIVAQVPYFLFLHMLVTFSDISRFYVYSPRSQKGISGMLNVVSSAENGCVLSHFSILGDVFSPVTKE